MGTTVGNILLSYDIKNKHNDVKEGLQELGYLDHFNFKGETKIYYLPNTTLWHSKKSSNQAMSDLKSVCRNCNVTLEKGIVVKATEFVSI
ncbi:hypothetical protein [Polaribacter porphyrae]|nr:hypothetical protein [Polaribacter porphyrae]